MTETIPRTGKERVNILLVDDQPAKLLSYEAILGELDETLIRAGSGNEALEHLLKTDVAVVLVDVCMPGLDGFELASLIRQHPRYQKTSIIFISAIQMTDLDRLKGYEAGAVDYVSVPVDPSLLRARVAIFADLYRKSRELERLNLELEQRVAERTAELESMQGALREADRRKDEFLAVLAHELRNPLAPIRNAVRILGLEGASMLEWGRDVIDRQVNHLTRLVDDLLDVSRIANGKLQLRRERADLSVILTGAVETIQPLVDQSGHRLMLELPEAPVELDADVVRLTQVFTNLLANSVKYMPSGGRIAVSAVRDDAQAVVRVRDEGNGISADELPHLFQMFYRPRGSDTSVEGGLGIGLTLVRRLVEMHGGSVTVSSPGIGQGSEFVVMLPLPAASVPDATSLPSRDGRAGKATRRVLVADDNRDSNETLAKLLELEGHEVRTAANGLEAVQAAHEFRPDVVLLDLGMPVMDGYEAARRIREHPWGRKTILMSITGWGQEKDRLRSREAGFDIHLTKPVDLDELMRLIVRPRE